MNIDVASYIEQLLFDHELIIIPDLGGIVSSYRPASIDNVQGLLHPPSKSLHFNKNLIINDGILIKHIATKHQLSERAAAMVVEEYVEKTQSKLDRREIVVFPGVGRLYQDYEANLQFLQDSTNFNVNSFGLNSVQFYPILRSKETASSEAPAPVIRQKKAKRRSGLSLANVLQSAMPLLAGLTLVAFGLTFYLFETESTHSGVPQKVPVADRFNKKPSNKIPTIEEAGILSAIDRRNGRKENHIETEPVSPPEKAPAPVEEEFDTKIDTESLSLGPDQKEGVIIIGTYNYKASVEKMVKEIYMLGFDVYKKKKTNSRATRVGVQFVYETEEDLEKTLKIVRKKIDDRAWVLKR